MEELVADLCDEGASVMDSLLVPLMEDNYGEAFKRVTDHPSMIPSAHSNACTDSVQGWVDSTGATCDEYKVNNWCEQFGDGYAGSDGLTANVACCGCGGGLEISPTIAPSLPTTPLTLVYSFGIRTDSELSASDILSGAVGIELLGEVSRILTASFSTIETSTINLTFMSVEPCDSTSKCYNILLRVNVLTTDFDLSTSDLEQSLRKNQQDGYYYNENIASFVAPPSSSGNSNNEAIYISIIVILIVVFLCLILLRKKYKQKELLEMEDVTNRDFVFENVIDSELQSPPQKQDVGHRSYHIQESYPKIHAAIPEGQYYYNPEILDDTDAAIILPPTHNHDDDGISQNRSVSFQIPDRDDEQASHAIDESTVDSATDFVTYDYQNTNTSMEATIEAHVKPKSLNAQPDHTTWGVAPSVSTTDSNINDLQFDSTPSYANQAMEAISLSMDNMCANLQTTAFGDDNNVYEQGTVDSQSLGTIDDASTWATEESKGILYDNTATVNKRSVQQDFGSTFTGTLSGFLETVPEDANADESMNSEMEISQTKSMGSTDLFPPNSYQATNIPLSRNRTENTAITTNTTNTQQASNTHSAVRKRQILSKPLDESPSPLRPHLMDDTSGVLSTSDDEDLYGSIPMSHTYPKPKTSKKYSDKYHDDSSLDLGSLGELSSADGSHSYNNKGNYSQSRSVPLNIVAGSSSLKDRSSSGLTNSSTSGTIQNNKGNIKDSTTTNAEFNDWLQNEIDSLKQKGSWQDIERLIENTPDQNESQTTQLDPALIRPSQSVDSMPDDEASGQLRSVPNEMKTNEYPLTNVRRMYT